jgi:hypothetical protein
LYAFLISPLRVTRPASLILLHLITLKISGDALETTTLVPYSSVSSRCFWRQGERDFENKSKNFYVSWSNLDILWYNVVQIHKFHFIRKIG